MSSLDGRGAQLQGSLEMCGIVGVYSRSGSPSDPGRLAAAIERLRRRGPDDSGTWSDTRVRLGHRRLAVVDLSPSGHQPMESSDGRYVVVFNGEIYNHRELRLQLDPVDGWRGTSDTETLLEAYREWGADCVTHFNGMFALAVWDRMQRRLFVARDRLGVKPLYYSWRDGELAFASRPGAVTTLLGTSGTDIDPEGLRIYLELGHIPAPLSFYRNVRKLRPGHYMLADERGLRVVRYWDYRHIVPDRSLEQRPEDELVEELDELIRQAVKLRLLSDVPLGVFLSGGNDSALVAAAMKAVGVPNPSAFTIGFKERAYDETGAASVIASQIGVDHVKEVLSVDSLLDLLPLYIEEFDEPFADSSAFPTMAVARLARRHVTVALTGDGGDELFGGYHYYSLVERLTRVTRWSPRAKRALAPIVAAVPGHKAKLLAGALGPVSEVALFQYLRSVSKDFTPLLSQDVLQSTSNAESWLAQMAASFAMDLTSAETGMRLDTGVTLPDGYLQKVDVATMAFSLEARCPLLDYRLVEWAMRLPVRYKIRGGQTKYLLKKVLCKYVSPESVYRPKRGFGVPVAQWLRGPLKDWAQDLLHDESTTSRLPIERAQLQELFRLHTSGARDAHPLLWAMLMLLCFVAHHGNGRALPSIARAHAA